MTAAPAAQRRSAAPPVDHSLQQPAQLAAPPQPNIDAAIAAISAELLGVTTDSDNPYYKSKFLSLPGIYDVLLPLLESQFLTVSSAIVFDSEARIFVVRTTISHPSTKTFVRSDFPVPSIDKKEATGSFMTYGIRYNIFALLAFFPVTDTESTEPPTNNGFASAPTNASWMQPAQQQQPVNSWQQPAVAGQPWNPQAQPAVDPGHGQQPPAGWAPPPPAGTQRTEPAYQPAQQPQYAPQVLS